MHHSNNGGSNSSRSCYSPVYFSFHTPHFVDRKDSVKLWIAAHSFQFTKVNCLINVFQFPSFCSVTSKECLFVQIQCVYEFRWNLIYMHGKTLFRIIFMMEKMSSKITEWKRQRKFLHCPLCTSKEEFWLLNNSLFTWGSFYAWTW